MYASYTHFKIRYWWLFPLFKWRASRSVYQARKSKGLVHMEVWAETLRDYCTFTVWESKEDMLMFISKGAHFTAMKTQAKLGMSRSIGWESGHKPHRDEGNMRLRDKLFKMKDVEWLTPSIF